MSPAAVEHSTTCGGSDAEKVAKSSTVVFLPQYTNEGRKSSHGRGSPPEYKVVRRHPNSPPPLVTFHSLLPPSPTTAGERLRCTPVKRVRPSSLCSPSPSSKVMKPFFERNFTDWLGNNSDQNSRDSGFESAASSSSSSHRSTPVDHRDVDVDALRSTGTATRRCQWDDCPNPELSDYDDEDELLRHILTTHVQPLETNTTSRSLEKFACRWKDCKVYSKPSRLYSWLERHVVDKHVSKRPYGCPVPGCRQRFGLHSSAERHVNSHFEHSTTTTVDNNVTTPATIASSKDNSTDLKTFIAILPSTSTRKKGTSAALISAKSDTDLVQSSAETVVVGAKEKCSAKILASGFTSATKKRNYVLKTNLSTDPFDDKLSSDYLAWHVSLLMTNADDRLRQLTPTTKTPSSISCRKRNSGMISNKQTRVTQRQSRTSTVIIDGGTSNGEDVTFHCKVLARRPDEDQFLVTWVPHGLLPSMWMPKSMYKSSFTFSSDAVARLRSSQNCVSTE